MLYNNCKILINSILKTPFHIHLELKEPAWKCRYVVTLFGFLVGLSMGIHRTVVSVSICAMVNSSAISQETTTKSNSCPDLIMNSTVEEILLERKKVCCFRIYNIY